MKKASNESQQVSLLIKIRVLTNQLRKIYAKAVSPVLAFSGGKDSSLLLHAIRRVADDRVNLLVFQDLWSDSHRRYVQSIALKYDLRVFLYSPVEIQAINDGKVVIPIYPFIGAHELPVIMDVKPTEECGRAKIDKVMRRLEPKPRYMFDATVFGSKATDNHDVPIGLDPTIYATMENRVYTPLWDWTDQEVIEACEYFSEEILNPAEYAPDGSRTGSDNGDFVACLNCFEISKKEVYCPKEKGTIPTVLNDAEKNPQV